MTSGFLTLHLPTPGTNAVHINPDKLILFFSDGKGSALLFDGGDPAKPFPVRESCEEIHQMLAELLRVTEYVPPFPPAGH